MNDDPYLYPGTTVLKNKLGIRNGAELDAVERRSVSERIAEGGRLRCSLDPPSRRALRALLRMRCEGGTSAARSLSGMPHSPHAEEARSAVSKHEGVSRDHWRPFETQPAAAPQGEGEG
jgi:hypothetical protein